MDLLVVIVAVLAVVWYLTRKLFNVTKEEVRVIAPKPNKVKPVYTKPVYKDGSVVRRKTRRYKNKSKKFA